MNSFRLGILVLVNLALAGVGADKVQAQILGNVYYGSGYYPNSMYSGVYTPGTYSTTGSFGSPFGYGYSNSYNLGYPYGSGYSYSTGNGYNTGNVYSFGNTVSTYNNPGTAYYGIGNLGYGATYGQSGYGYTSPLAASPSPAYATSTSILRSGPTGGVMQYTANGDGYTYVPDSTYPTLILNQPTLGLSRTYVPPSQNPVVIEVRPNTTSTSQSANRPLSPLSSTNSGYQMIKLVLPKTATGSLTYSLNGHLYTIQPGYSQTFRNDRLWTIEFKRDNNAADVVRYALNSGTYAFNVGAAGWELQQPSVASQPSLPPSPQPPPVTSSAAPTLLPEYVPSATGVPSLSNAPTPLPPP